MFKRNPSWLDEVLQAVEENSLDELVIRGDGYSFGTRKQENLILKENFIKGSSFTRDLQEFSLSRGLRLDPKSPFSGGTLGAGAYRWQCVIPPVVKESILFLRRHRFEALSLEDFSYENGVRSKLDKLVQEGSPFVILGATGAGKTSFMQAILREYFISKRLLILEEYEEIHLESPLWSRLLARKEGIEAEEAFSLSFIFKEALRLRPDQLVLGELRSEELKVFFEACHSGHKSTCATMHGGSLEDLKKRILLILGGSYSQVMELLSGLSLGVILLSFQEGEKPKIQALENLRSCF